MIKKTIKIIGCFSLIAFSFFYTDQAVNIVKMSDPIMKKIKQVEKNYVINPVSAIIENDTITSGVYGRKIDLEESYNKMKKANGFYESMITFEEVVPNISLLNNYDKFIVRGNTTRNEIALIFKVDNFYNLNKIYEKLVDKEIMATFFIDGILLEENSDLIYQIIKDGYEIENFGYNDIYSKEMFDWTNNIIFALSNNNPKFCYTEYNNYDILDLCKNYKMYTIKPLVVNSSPFLTIKNNLDSGMIFALNINDEVVKELPTIITYIKQKGYDLVSLNQIILEDRILEK